MVWRLARRYNVLLDSRRLNRMIMTGSFGTTRQTPWRRSILMACLLVLALCYMSFLILSRAGHAETNEEEERGEPTESRLPRSAVEPPSPPPPAETSIPIPAASSPASNLLDDVFISVKTSVFFHDSRLQTILKTWFPLARDQTYFFTDVDDKALQSQTGGHLINTNCTASHHRKDLCCKMAVEFDTFLQSNKKWFCHVDDDNYVNVPRLGRLLSQFDPRDEWYLGKPSIRNPILISAGPSQNLTFWFATGGAGFCISRALALRMAPLASGGKFIDIGNQIRLPDDVTIGYIIEHLLKKNLTVVDQFHSHLEPMKFLNPDEFAEQVTFSYAISEKSCNILSIDGFSMLEDPTRFLSLHCYLFPSFSYCSQMSTSLTNSL